MIEKSTSTQIGFNMRWNLNLRSNTGELWLKFGRTFKPVSTRTIYFTHLYQIMHLSFPDPPPHNNPSDHPFRTYVFRVPRPFVCFAYAICGDTMVGQTSEPLVDMERLRCPVGGGWWWPLEWRTVAAAAARRWSTRDANSLPAFDLCPVWGGAAFGRIPPNNDRSRCPKVTIYFCGGV